MIFSKKTEVLIATHNFSIVLLVLIWKSVGLDWLPLGLSEAWKDIFNPSKSYYPRHDRHETEYNLFYLVFYGIFGFLAQLSSLRLINNPLDTMAKRIFGAFHVSIAIYHIIFAFRLVEVDFVFKPYGSSKKVALDMLSFLNIMPLGMFLLMIRTGLENKMAALLINVFFFILFPFILLTVSLIYTFFISKENKKKKV